MYAIMAITYLCLFIETENQESHPACEDAELREPKIDESKQLAGC